MHFIIDTSKIIDYLESNVRFLMGFLFQWISTDGEVLSYILAVLHVMLTIIIFTILFISHTIYPTLWLQSLALFFIFVLWIQHVILKVCIFIVAEEKLTNGKAPFFQLINDISSFFRIPFDRFIENVFLAETISLASFTLAFIGRISVYLHEYYRVKL